MLRKFAAGALVAGMASLWLTAAHAHSIKAEPNEAVQASFDIIETTIVTRGDAAVFTTRVRGQAGTEKPRATGKFEGSDVYAYVWPTSLNSGDIGFERDQGIVALAVTFHPDFDDGARKGAFLDRALEHLPGGVETRHRSTAAWRPGRRWRPPSPHR